MPHNDSWAPKHAHFGPLQPPVRMVHEKQMKDWQQFVCEHVDGPANFSIENHLPDLGDAFVSQELNFLLTGQILAKCEWWDDTFDPFQPSHITLSIDHVFEHMHETSIFEPSAFWNDLADGSIYPHKRLDPADDGFHSIFLPDVLGFAAFLRKNSVRLDLRPSSANTQGTGKQKASERVSGDWFNLNEAARKKRIRDINVENRADATKERDRQFFTTLIPRVDELPNYVGYASFTGLLKYYDKNMDGSAPEFRAKLVEFQEAAQARKRRRSSGSGSRPRREPREQRTPEEDQGSDDHDDEDVFEYHARDVVLARDLVQELKAAMRTMQETLSSMQSGTLDGMVEQMQKQKEMQKALSEGQKTLSEQVQQQKELLSEATLAAEVIKLQKSLYEQRKLINVLLMYARPCVSEEQHWKAFLHACMDKHVDPEFVAQITPSFYNITFPATWKDEYAKRLKQLLSSAHAFPNPPS